MIHDDVAAQPAGDAIGDGTNGDGPIDDGTSAGIWHQLISW
jgi:hypothetical protein